MAVTNTGYNNQGHVAFALAIVFIPVEIFCVILRFWARKIGKVPLGVDDILIVPGLIFCVGVCVGCLVDLTAGGVAHHIATLEANDPNKIIVWAKAVLALPIIYVAAVLFPKLAILAIYLRIFTQAPYRISCYVLALILIANWLGTTIAGFLMCIPLRYLWDKTVVGGHCFDLNAYLRWGSFGNIVTDIIMLLLPLPVIWRLHTSRNIKIGLTITFATGSVGLITSVIRFANFFGQDAEKDGTYSATTLVIWTICETATYLIAACLPRYRPLAVLFWKRSPSFSFRSGSKGNVLKHSQSLSDGFNNPTGTIRTVDSEVQSDERMDLADPANSSAASQIALEQFPDDEAHNRARIIVRHDIKVSSTYE